MKTFNPIKLRSTLRPRLLGALAAPIAAAILMAFPTPSFAGIELSVNIAPPPIPVYVQPPLPGEGYIWTPGYWAYDQDDNDYYWVPGTWVRPPTVGYLWTPGYWGYEGGRYAFRSGYWGPHIGFYGGINYGYGYGGRGYEGGYWNHGAFYYNRNVNTFGEFRVRNVYERPVVYVTINRVSFNGGAGGIELRASREEERAERERHIDRVQDQQRQVEMARQNRELRASVNHGAPTIAATPKAGVFAGPGVVRAREATAEERAAATARESKVNAEAPKTNGAEAKANAEAAKTNNVDAKANTAAGQKTSVDAKANAEAAKTARENGTSNTPAGQKTSVDAKANAEAARTAREDARAKAKAARTERQDARMKSDATQSEKPQPKAEGNGMQQDRNPRANGPRPERADRPAQAGPQGEPKARAERAPKAAPAARKGNDKKKDDNSQQK